ncbi:hypothetical protein [Solicola sp. PLA-1-18]|uniref:hypothetical protein n=1 Tax=Solicola sp. PLA-1-18 TaxID=3380532 RepID=UPI003B8271B0
MLDDDAYLAALMRGIANRRDQLVRNQNDGYDRDYWVAGLRVVASPDGWDDVEITVGMRVPWRYRRRVDPTTTARTLFDRQWRLDNGLDDPASMVDAVVTTAYFAGVRAYQRARGEVADEALVQQVRDELPDARTLWDQLVETTRGRVTGVDRFEVTETDDEVFTVVVTPEQWRECVVDGEVAARTDSGRDDALEPGDGFAEAAFEIEETIGSAMGPDRYVVLFRGRFHLSAREALPPLGSPFDDF